MKRANVHAGRLERRVRLVGRETLLCVHGFCSFFPFGAIRGKAAIALYNLTNALYRVDLRK